MPSLWLEPEVNHKYKVLILMQLCFSFCCWYSALKSRILSLWNFSHESWFFCQRESTCSRQNSIEKSTRKAFVSWKADSEMSLAQMSHYLRWLREKSSQGPTRYTGWSCGIHCNQRAINIECTSGSHSLPTSKRSFSLDFLGGSGNTFTFVNTTYFDCGRNSNYE